MVRAARLLWSVLTAWLITVSSCSCGCLPVGRRFIEGLAVAENVAQVEDSEEEVEGGDTPTPPVPEGHEGEDPPTSSFGRSETCGNKGTTSWSI